MRKAVIVAAVLLLATVLITGGCGPESESESADAARIEGLLAEMSLAEKVGQVMIVAFAGPSFSPELQQTLQKLRPGGVILYDVMGNIGDVRQVAGLVSEIQQFTLDSGRIPLFISADQEGGLVCRITEGVTVFPGNMTLGAAGSEGSAALSAAITARELRILGLNFNLAPVLDVNNNPANPVIGVRSFGADPAAVARLGQAVIGSYRSEQVVSAAKHFPGHGDTHLDSHHALPLITQDRRRLDSVELIPFQAAVDAGVPAIMSAHLLVPALTGSDTLPVTLSSRALGYLRDEMGFSGLIISDSMGMGAITGQWTLEEASIIAFLSGVDLLLFGADVGADPDVYARLHRVLLEAVQSGSIPVERLDQSVRRILAVKMEYGIIDDPMPRWDSFSELASTENMAAALQIARDGVTLVRDYPGLIPLPQSSAAAPVPLIWPTEREPLLDILLAGGVLFVEPYLLPLEPASPEVTRLAETLQGAPLILVATYDLHRRPAWSGLINMLAEEGTPVAVIAMRSPYDLLQVPGVGTYLAVYGDRPVSLQALGEILRGDSPPGGRLPVELPGLQ